MHAGQLIESLEPFSAEVAERWIAAALAESAALIQHDESLWPATRDPQDLQVAHQLRDAWTHWADDAERLLARIKAFGLSPSTIPQSQQLIHTLGRTRAMLKLTPEMMLDRQESVDRGEVMTIEEVRRELRAEAANDATSDLQDLPPWLQEEVLDEIEKIVASVPQAMRIDKLGRAAHDFARITAGQEHVVFMRLHVDREHSVVTVTAIKDWSRPAAV